MASYNIELNNNPVRGSNDHALLLRITVNRKHARMKLNYAVTPKQFNSTPKQLKYIRASHPNHAKINKYIADKIQQAKDAENELARERKVITADLIKKRLSQPTLTSFTFNTAYKRYHLSRHFDTTLLSC